MNEIIGGIQPKPSTIKLGGVSYKVGDVSKFNIRHKYILWSLMNDENSSPKHYLHIVNMSTPVQFNKKAHTSDDPPLKKNTPSTKSYEDKIIKMINNRIHNHKDFIHSLIKEYQLTEPLRLALLELTIVILKSLGKGRPNMRKIKVNPYLGEFICFLPTKYFKYDVESDIKSLSSLIIHLIDRLKSTKKDIKWDITEECKYPSFEEFEHTSHPKTIREGIKAILDLEFKYSDYLEQVEQYYVKVSREIHRMTLKLKSLL